MPAARRAEPGRSTSGRPLKCAPRHKTRVPLPGGGHEDRAMALIVHKYGGTSMGSTERIRSVAKRVAKWARAGHQMVVVPSAMSGETNRLLGLARELAPADHERRIRTRARHASPRPASRCRSGCWRSPCRPRAWPRSATPAGRCRSRPTPPTPRRASRASTTRACAPTSRPGASSSSPASRAWTRRATSRRSAAAAPTPRPSPSRRR